MRSVALAPAMLARCNSAAASSSSATAAAAPARSFFSASAAAIARAAGVPQAAAAAASSSVAAPSRLSFAVAAPMSLAPRRCFSSDGDFGGGGGGGGGIKRVVMPWEYDPSADQVRDERGRLLKGEKAAEYKQRLAEQQAAEKEEYEKTRTVMTWKEDKEMGSRDAEEIVKVLTKFKLHEFAEKFVSMQHLLNVNVRELKAFGLTVKQRKTLLKALTKFKLSRRVAKANAFINAEGATMEPERLQQAVFNIIYRPMYDELAWRAASVGPEEAWRASIAKYKDERLQDHSELRGLREPDLMELAKMEAHMIAETLHMRRAGYEKQSIRLERAGIKENDPMVTEGLDKNLEREFGRGTGGGDGEGGGGKKRGGKKNNAD